MKCLKPISNTLLIKFFREQLGKNNISDIGDGTITGAIKYLKDNKSSSDNSKEIKQINDKIGTTDFSTYGSTLSGAIHGIGDFLSALSDVISQNSFDTSTLKTEFEKIKVKILWNNDDITQPIGNVSYQLNESMYNYNFYCVMYTEDTSCAVTLSTGLSITTLPNARLITFDTDKMRINRRTFTIGENKIAITNCYSMDILNKNNNMEDNFKCVPLCLLGFYLPLK